MRNGRTLGLVATATAGALLIPVAPVAIASAPYPAVARGAAPLAPAISTTSTTQAAALAQQAAPSQIAAPAVGRKKIRRSIKKSRLNKGRRPGRYERPEPYVRQTACHQAPKPGVVDFQNMLKRLFPRPEESFRSYNIPGFCLTPGAGEHAEGRAIDYEFDIDKRKERKQASELLKFLTKRKGYHAKRLGMMYIIWNQRVWGVYNQRWRKMSDRGSKVHNHRDHIHISFTWNGALKRSSYWSGRTRSTHYGPCPKYRGQFAAYRRKARYRRCGSGRSIPKGWYSKTTATIKPWETGDRVTRLQQYLATAGVYRGEVTGSFGATTFKAVRRWQKRNGVSKTGVWDRESQRKSRQAFWPRTATSVKYWSTEDAILTEGQTVSDWVTIRTGDGTQTRTVQVQQRAVGATDWTVVTRATTGADGRYLAQYTAPIGAWEFRLAVEDSPKLQPGVSQSRRVDVMAAPAAIPSLAPEVSSEALPVAPEDVAGLDASRVAPELGSDSAAAHELPLDTP